MKDRNDIPHGQAASGSTDKDEPRPPALTETELHAIKDEELERPGPTAEQLAMAEKPTDIIPIDDEVHELKKPLTVTEWFFIGVPIVIALVIIGVAIYRALH